MLTYRCDNLCGRNEVGGVEPNLVLRTSGYEYHFCSEWCLFDWLRRRTGLA